tara:strand:+ start:282 stop:656 length:375 start_codon:yes stop_codon:yes gene_type:complete
MPVPFGTSIEKQFKLVNNRDNINDFASGTYYIGEIDIVPSKLIAKFGSPMSGDSYKVSGEYVFEGNTGRPITLYDWKWTTLYDKNNPFTPSGFWMFDKPIRMNVGGKNKSDFYDFERWIKHLIK